MKLKDLLNAKLLTGLAVVGVGATIFFAVRETKKAVAAEPMPKDQPVYKTAYKFAWMYKGTILSAAITVGSIIGAQKLNEKEILALSGTIGYLAANRDKAEKWIAKTDPDGEHYQAYQYAKNPPGECFKGSLPIEDTGYGEDIFRELYTGRWLKGDLDAIEQGILRFKERFDNGERLDLNDFYFEIGLMGTLFGSTVGWNPAHSLTRRLDIDIVESEYTDEYGEVHKYRMISFDAGSFPYNWFKT